MCSGFGVHNHHSSHHCHTYACATHGVHYYHVRDCSVCYPHGYREYRTHEAGHEAGHEACREAGHGSGDLSVATTGGSESIDRAKTESVDGAAEGGGILSGFSPAKLTFAYGFLAFQNGDFNQASEYFFNASVEDAESPVPRFVLATSLMSIAEYDFAADYLRKSFEMDDALVGHDFNLRAFYGEARATELAEHRKLLAERAELYPSEADTQLLKGYLDLSVGDLDSAGLHFAELRDLADSDVDRALADRLLAKVAERKSSQVGAVASDDPLANFLAAPSLEGIEALSIQ